jgi:uncharacterized protein YjbI with pentapeptide repeats
VRSRTPRLVAPLVLVLGLAVSASGCLGSGGDSTIGDCNLRHGATCPGNYMRGAHMVGADLWGADLTHADMSNTLLVGANLTGARLSFTNLSGADLTGANLSNADLRHANLTGANLTGANLTGAALVDEKGLTQHQLDSASLCMTVVAVEGQQVDRNC